MNDSHASGHENIPLPAARPPLPLIRPGRDEDGWDLVGLIAACWSEYPGCILDVDGEEPWLRAPASAYRAEGGQLWVAEEHGRVVGSVGLKPAGAGAALKNLYVARFMRGRGLGSHLAELVETTAKERGAAFVELWSDTRFLDAHRLYERRGYGRGPETRQLHDLSRTVEFYYRKAL